MDTIEAILTRRSIRAFTPEEISEADLETMLRAGMAAPSANNKQPWHFVIVRERATLQKIKTIHPYAAMADTAAIGILVCGDSEIEDMEGYLSVDCAAATQNILLVAHASDFGAVWCGVYPREHRVAAFREMFSLPGNILPISLILAGYPERRKDKAERFIPSRVHLEHW